MVADRTEHEDSSPARKFRALFGEILFVQFFDTSLYISKVCKARSRFVIVTWTFLEISSCVNSASKANRGICLSHFLSVFFLLFLIIINASNIEDDNLPQ